jgi:hypothetical protein
VDPQALDLCVTPRRANPLFDVQQRVRSLMSGVEIQTETLPLLQCLTYRSSTHYFDPGMGAFESNYAKVEVWHYDPRDVEEILTNRSFRVQIFHAFENNSEDKVDDLLIEGSITDVIGFLEILGVDRLESADGFMSVVGSLSIDTAPFEPRDAIAHLTVDPRPMTCFVTDITKDVFLKRLLLWQMGCEEKNSIAVSA